MLEELVIEELYIGKHTSGIPPPVDERKSHVPGQAENGISHHAGSFVKRLLGGNDRRCRLPSQIERTQGRDADGR